MNALKRIISLFVVFAIVASLCLVPVCAADTELVPYENGEIAPYDGGQIYTTPTGQTVQMAGLSYWLLQNCGDLLAGTEKAGHMVRGIFDRENACLSVKSPNGRHNFIQQTTSVDGNTGIYYICEYCGRSGGEVFDGAYGDYVDELPVNGIDSAGGYLWYPTVSDLTYIPGYSDRTWTVGNNGYLAYGIDFPYETKEISVYSIEHGFNIVLSFTAGVNANSRVNVNYSLNAPVGGTYTRVPDLVSYDFYYISDNGERISDVYEFSGETTHCNIQDNIRVSSYMPLAKKMYYYNGNRYFGVYKIVPDSPLPQNSYITESRPASILGDYGIIGDNGQITVSNDTYIYNESSGELTNPATGDTTTYNEWQYDYSTRTYNLTNTNDNSTATVTYGDEYVTITEGGNTYNIYYYLVDTHEDEPVPAHTHTYTDVITREPTCTLSGVRTYTCTECNQSYTESIAALGHDWQIKSQVNTEYDNETGDLVTQGYTIYQCSRCGEEFKDEDGSGPPAVADYNNSTGLQLLGDKLTSFFSLLPEMFGELTEFLKVGFGYLPEDVLTLIEFSVAVGVLAALFKFIRG